MKKREEKKCGRRERDGEKRIREKSVRENKTFIRTTTDRERWRFDF